MSDLNELDNFLETPEAVETTTAADTGKQDAPEEAKAEESTTEGKGEKDAETPSAEKDESTAKASEKHWSETAYLDEKRKRQALEQEIEALKKPKQEEEKPDIFADPDGFTKSLEEKMTRQNLQTKVSLSREFMADIKPDFAEKEAKFIEMANADPGLVQKMHAAANPAKFAYETAAKQIAFDAIGDPIAYREKLKQELLAELGEKPAVPEKPVKPPIDKAPSLATASAAKSNTEIPSINLEDIFAR